MGDRGSALCCGHVAETFGCRVANGCGGRDAGFIAHECPQGGMHITAEDLIQESLERTVVPVVPGAGFSV
ncbi:MAG: hypothetical protein KDJ31_17470 [Candidatus Competibacteraceae bacterium]|nr:hypothetical protein [Candidatus Competibacteraceae bacterium]